MTCVAKTKSSDLNGENIVQHGAITLEFVSHSDRNKADPLTKKKVQDLLTEMYVRAKKRGRPKFEEEKEAA